MNKITNLFLGTVLLTFGACTSQPSNQDMTPPIAPEDTLVFDKLLGTWKSKDGKSFERWTKNADGNYHSSVYTLNGKDTVFTEEADIFKEKGRWIFENIVSGQNDGQKTRFASESVDEGNVRFTNPAHDFPTEINYTMPDMQTVNAFIVGKNEQGMDTIPFDYTRLNR